MKEPVYQSQMPAGAERYGATRGTEQSSFMPTYISPGVEPAPPSGVKFVGDGHCIIVHKSTGNQCRANKVWQTDLCMGHLNALKKWLEATGELKDESPKDSESPEDSKE